MLIGLTGQTGAGKSDVGAILRELGFDVIDADAVSREVTHAGGECLREIVAGFGEGILFPDGKLDRKALGAVVFTDAAAKKKLEAIIFPHIICEIDKRVGEIGFLDGATLFESGADKSCAKIVSVVAPPELRMKRIMERDNLTWQEAENRMNSQYDDDWYISRSDYVIRNDETGDKLRDEVEKMIATLVL